MTKNQVSETTISMISGKRKIRRATSAAISTSSASESRATSKPLKADDELPSQPNHDHSEPRNAPNSWTLMKPKIPAAIGWLASRCSARATNAKPKNTTNESRATFQCM